MSIGNFGAISLQGSVDKYLELGLDQKDICRAISPSCFGEQNAGQFLIEGIGRVFTKTSSENLKLVAETNKKLESVQPLRRLIGVRSIEPKSLFSLEMLLRVQHDANSGSELAKTTLKSLNAYLNNKTSEASLNKFCSDLSKFSASII